MNALVAVHRAANARHGSEDDETPGLSEIVHFLST
jgi:hypothetical protein